MSKSVRVKFILIDGPQAGKVTVRMRWVLAESDGSQGTAASPSRIEFPLPSDVFHVRIDNDAGKFWPFDVRPHPFVMLDPPRRQQKEVSKGHKYADWLPLQGDWKAVDPAATDLRVDPNDPDSDTLALGVTHLLGQASQFSVVRRLRDAAAETLGGFLATQHANFKAMSADEVELHALQFASAFHLFPGPPKHLKEACRTLLANRSSSLPGWLESALDIATPNVVAQSIPKARRFAALLELLLHESLYKRAVRIKSEADDVRGLMAMRAAQGGRLLDYGCDYDKKADEKPSDPCLPANQSRMCWATEAVGLGADYVLDSTDASGLKVTVEHDRSVSVASSAYIFPDAASSKGYDPGTYRLAVVKGRTQKAAKVRDSIPAADAFSAWVDYDLVSSNPVPEGKRIEDLLEEVMSVAKPLTGDGMLAIRVQLNAPRPSEAAYDYLYNVYGVWDGETSGRLQKYLDDPKLQPTLEELRPYLITRRYSYRRDLAELLGRLPPQKVAELKLNEEPPHEAALQMPLEISQNGVVVPYPSKGTLPPGLSQFLINLRAGQPSADAVAAGTKWERVEGARPDLYSESSFWTVERLRVDSTNLPDDRMPQRYRFWVTAVDVFEQESDPIPVVGAAPVDTDVDRFVFTPRWRSPPPPPKELLLASANNEIVVTWKPDEQSVIGSSEFTVPRVGVASQYVVLRRPVKTLQDPDARLRFAESALEGFALAGPVNPVLERAVAEAGAKEGWASWQDGYLEPGDKVGDAWTVKWPLTGADLGYEYRALVCDVVSQTYLKYVQEVRDQTLRYLIQSGTVAAPVFEEAAWAIPMTGEHSLYRNYPAFSAVAASDPRMLLPSRGSLPILAAQWSKQEFVRASAVRAVLGINRDAALAKFLALSNFFIADGELSIAEGIMLDAALERLEANKLSDEQLSIVRKLLKAEFIAATRSGAIGQHPVIGFRGAIDLRWSQVSSPATTAPTILYRIYSARASLPGPSTLSQYKFDGTVYRYLSGPKPGVIPGRPLLVLLSLTNKEQWSGLADFKGADFRVAGISALAEPPIQPSGEPKPGDVLNCAFYEGHVAFETSAFTLESEVATALPIDGGHRELAAWWLVAVNCINDEQWLTLNGEPVLHTRTLFESVTPDRPMFLEARPPADYTKDALQQSKYQGSIQFIPTNLLKEAAPIFPRTIVSFNTLEFAGPEQYIFLERETQLADDSPIHVESAGMEWGFLKAIESQSAGSPWQTDYLLLRPWLSGGPAPIPPEGAQYSNPMYFFPLDSGAAWALKRVDMLDGAGSPTNVSSFVDYFAFAPGDPAGDQGTEPSRGTAKVRYRAYKVLDLTPEAGSPDPTSSPERFLTSEASAWTSWVRPEWPPFSFWPPTSKDKLRDSQPLVQFSVGSRYAASALNAFGSALALDDPSKLLFRVALRRKMNAAFTALDADRSVGELLEVPVLGDKVAWVETADHSLERDAPGQERAVLYSATSSLIWRRLTSTGEAFDEELRASADPFAFQVLVPALSGGAEAAMCVYLEVRIG